VRAIKRRQFALSPCVTATNSSSSDVAGKVTIHECPKAGTGFTYAETRQARMQDGRREVLGTDAELQRGFSWDMYPISGRLQCYIPTRTAAARTARLAPCSTTPAPHPLPIALTATQPRRHSRNHVVRGAAIGRGPGKDCHRLPILIDT
jgi:hypothetical protein